MPLHVVDHPLIREKLTTLRASESSRGEFRAALRAISLLLGYEALRDLGETSFAVTTPLGAAPANRLAAPVHIFPILRAGLGMAEALLELLPEAAVGHIGMFRDEETLLPHPYYLRVPPGIEGASVLCVDPMLATGHSAVAALDQLKQKGARDLRLVGIVGCPEGVACVTAAHPDVPIVLAAVDDGLNAKGYIVPGLGDAGDRYFGT